MKKTFYITTSIAYANSKPHIGFALELAQADVLARFHRYIGNKVFFLTGTDDHGVKIADQAQKLGISPKELVSENAADFKNLTKKLEISNDDFISTSDKKKHWPGAIAMWKRLKKSGNIYKKLYRGLYCSGCEAYLTQKDLVDRLCPNHQRKPDVIEEENYFFRISRYTKKIKKMIERDELVIFPEERKNEVLKMVGKMEDVSFSRQAEKLSWGIPVPGDENHTMYVWCDALSNYISALGYGSDNETKFKKFWPADIQIIGKDILKFHAIIWPAMLLAAKLKLPKTIFVHGFITSSGQKMSKSLGNVIDPFEIIKKYGADSLRYYLLREIPRNSDGDFSWKRFKELYNNELANELGNLVNRVVSLAQKNNIKLMIKEKKWNASPQNLIAIKNFKFDEVIKDIWAEIRLANICVEQNKPWELAKTDKDKLAEVLNSLASDLCQIACDLEFFLPATAKKIIHQLKTLKAEVLFPRVDE